MSSMTNYDFNRVYKLFGRGFRWSRRGTEEKNNRTMEKKRVLDKLHSKFFVFFSARSAP